MGLGYTYPELRPWLEKYLVGPGGVFDEGVYLDDVRRQVNELYSSTRSAILVKTPKDGGEGGAQQAVLSQENDQVSHDDYVVNVMYKK